MTEKENLKKDFIKHLSSIVIGNDVRWQMTLFVLEYPFKDKKIKFFLSLKNDNEKLGFIYKYIMTAAYQYGVPKVYINKVRKTKESYNFWKKNGSIDNVDKRKREMQVQYYELLLATNELIRSKNSRKEKILNILDKKNKTLN
ncbi:MAG: hypothetical protein WDA02_05875 [Saccharofermentanales bacterium]